MQTCNKIKEQGHEQETEGIEHIGKGSNIIHRKVDQVEATEELRAREENVDQVGAIEEFRARGELLDMEDIEEIDETQEIKARKKHAPNT